MRVDNSSRSFKIGSIIFVFAFLIFIVALIIFSAIEVLLLDIIWIIAVFSFYLLISVFATIYNLSYYTIDETGITRCFLFSKKHYSWDDLQFIAKARHYIRFSGSTGETITVSVTIPKENFKRKHAFRLFSKKSFYMPYSKAVEDYIIAKSPVGCYSYSYIVDNTTDERIKRWYT